MADRRTSTEPTDPTRFTGEWDRAYTTWARAYDLAVRVLPVWKTWIRRDMGALFRECGFEFAEEAIGAWGSVRLYVATKSA